MALFKSKNKFSIFQRKHETYLFELVMEEIANNKRQKGIWGQAIVKANGDNKKAEAEYIRLRVESLKDELEIIKQEEDERAFIQEEVNKKAKMEKKQKAKSNTQSNEKIKVEKKNTVITHTINILGIIGLLIILFAIGLLFMMVI